MKELAKCISFGVREWEWEEDMVLAAYVVYLGSFRKWRGVKTVLEGLKT